MAGPSHLLTKFGTTLRANVTLAPFTYIKIGGPAEWLLIVNTPVDLIEAVRAAQADRLPITILGAASNILISDSGLKGLVIINRVQQIIQDPKDPSQLNVAAGTPMNLLVQFSLTHNLASLENFLGLPGTVGGAIYNNSHHLRDLIGNYVTNVTILDETLRSISLRQ
jgi:UDP-N-acetylmuramate dehydrogenase